MDASCTSSTSSKSRAVRKRPWKEGCSPQLLVMGAPKISGGSLHRQILLFRRTTIEKAQGRAVEGGVDGVLDNQFLQSIKEHGSQFGKRGTCRYLIEKLTVFLNGLHARSSTAAMEGSICKMRAKHCRSRAG